jgi:hypothetical protein
MKCRIPDADLGQKINDTVCRYKGQPVYVRTGDKGKSITLFKLDETDKLVATITKDDVNFDIASIALGYVNGERTLRALYVSRLPLRRTKQGIDPRALKISAIPGSGAGAAPNSTSIIFSKSFIEMVNNTYPSVEEALPALRAALAKDGTTGSIAVSKDIAISIDKMGIVRVHYKNEYVGWIQPNKFLVHVPSDSGLSWVISKYLSHVLGWQID